MLADTPDHTANWTSLQHLTPRPSSTTPHHDVTHIQPVSDLSDCFQNSAAEQTRLDGPPLVLAPFKTPIIYPQLFPRHPHPLGVTWCCGSSARCPMK